MQRKPVPQRTPEPPTMPTPIHRRQFSTAVVAGLTTASSVRFLEATQDTPFRFNYLLASSLYGYLYLGEILPEVRATGATAIDLWPKVHGNQREQVDDLGDDTFRRMLEAHQIELGCITQYKLGPYGLQAEMRFAQRFGCQTLVTGSPSKPRDANGNSLSGGQLKAAVAEFVSKMQPHLAVAEETGITIAIENHASSLIDSPDSMRWLAELSGDRLGIAFAPYHLPQDAQLLGQLIRDLDHRIKVFYAWEHGSGSMQRQPKEQELRQLPGRGELDFRPMVEALAAIDYRGWTEIFMHPFPRGIPILETVAEIREAINASRQHLEELASG